MTIRIPYGRQTVDESDVRAVLETLKSDWLTQGPAVEKFEKALADYCGVKYAVAYSSGTAALHGAYAAAGLGPGDELITTALTFAATANAALYVGAEPAFADVDADSGLLNAASVETAATKKTKAIATVDYAGQPVDYDAFRALCRKNKWTFISDACHSLGAVYKGKKVGGLADLSVFSFHPVKSITTGEGGAVLTNDAALAAKLRGFRQHGITKDGMAQNPGEWFYEMQALGMNYRLTDIQCALGLSQMARLEQFMGRRRALAARYARAFADVPGVRLLPERTDSVSAWHLYPVRVAGRDRVFKSLRAAGLGVQVHYIPVHLHPHYRGLGYAADLCPNARAFYAGEISLPMFPTLTDAQQDETVSAVRAALEQVHADRPAR